MSAREEQSGSGEHSQNDPLLSDHEHESGPSAASRTQGDSGQDRVPRSERPEWVEDVPGPKSRDSSPEDSLEHGVVGEPRHRGYDDPSSQAEVVEPELVEEADRLIPIILARLDQHQHLHLPIQMPDPDALAELKRKDPKAHKAWLKEVKRQMKHQRFMESARYKMPLKVIRSSQLVALLALLGVLAVAAYALYLDRPWVAGVLAALDIVTIVAIFAGIGRPSQDD